MKHLLILATIAAGLISCTAWSAQTSWQPAAGPLKTRWAKDVSPTKVHPEYPRPQMVRKDWLNLNGLWDYAITPKDAAQPGNFQGRILVPFPVESALSGVMKPVTEKDRVWYRRDFELPRRWSGQRVLLHFGAVDFDATVWVNGKQIGQHRGGYDPFSFDITDAIKRRGQNEIVVSVFDATDASPQSRGKQVRKPDQGIFYTATTGIWQTLWLEPVSTVHLNSIKITPDVDGGAVAIGLKASAASGEVTVKVSILDGLRKVNEGNIKMTASGPEIEISPNIKLPVPNAKLWSPDSPFLYQLKLTVLHNGKEVDQVASYFGLRKISLGQDKGVTKIFLNNKPFFMLGPLDQGFWPDGLYTAPTDEALRYDIEMTKKLGFNMARKHVKVEPDRWYYWCDKLGLLVWQDMPSGDKFIGTRDPDIQRTPESAQQFETELKALIETHYNHPSIVQWVVFNEGWGQYDTARLVQWVKQLDPSRLVNNASGWSDRGVGDVNDMHAYPGPGSPKPEPTRAAVLGEFGGLGFKVDGHTWAGKTWGYRGMPSIERLTQQYIRLLRGVSDLKESPGLSAAVYTQTTDVEYEGNGLLTYDREVVKMPIDKVAAANRGEFPPLPKMLTVVPAAQTEAISWRYTTDKPGDDWFKPSFSAASWKEGPAGFGTQGTPGAVVRTEWKTSDIWLRRDFVLPDGKVENLHLLWHHDEDSEVYINGILAAKAAGYTGNYEDADLTPEAQVALKPGPNVLAVHCHQTLGGQYIDVGLVKILFPVK